MRYLGPQVIRGPDAEILEVPAIAPFVAIILKTVRARTMPPGQRTHRTISPHGVTEKVRPIGTIQTCIQSFRLLAKVTLVLATVGIPICTLIVHLHRNANLPDQSRVRPKDRK